MVTKKQIIYFLSAFERNILSKDMCCVMRLKQNRINRAGRDAYKTTTVRAMYGGGGGGAIKWVVEVVNFKISYRD